MGVSAGLLGEHARRRASSPARDYDLSALRAIGSTGSPLCAGELPLGLRARRLGHLAVLDERRHRRVHGLRRRLPAAAGLRGRTAVPRARLRGGGLGRAGPQPRRRGRRAGDHRADALDAAVLLERSRRRAPARELLLDVPRHLAPRRLDPHHAARRRRDLRALGLDDQPPGRAHGHERDLPRGRRGARRCSTRWWSTCPSRERRRASCGWCCSWCCARASTLDEELAAQIKRRIREDCSPRHVPNEIRQIERGAAHALGQGARGAGQADPDGRRPPSRRRASSRWPTPLRSTTSWSWPRRSETRPRSYSPIRAARRSPS